jgi:hypothetical protein
VKSTRKDLQAYKTPTQDHYSLGAVASPAYEPEHSSSTEFLEPDQIIFSPISFHSSRISSIVQSPNQFENIPATRALQTLTSRPSMVSPLSYMTRAAVIKWLQRNRSKIDFASAPKWTDASAKRLPYRSLSRFQLHKEYLKFQVEITTVKRLIEVGTPFVTHITMGYARGLFYSSTVPTSS